MREWGAEALTALIKAGLAYNHDPPLSQNQVGETLNVCAEGKGEVKERVNYAFN